MTRNNAAKHGAVPIERVIIVDASLELLGPLLQERNILGASPSSSSRISSVATRRATEPSSAAPPRPGTLHRPSSDAEASTERAPRPAVWASTALSSGRVVVRGAAGEGSGGHRRRREAREALKSGPGASFHPSGGAGWAQELIQDFMVRSTTPETENWLGCGLPRHPARLCPTHNPVRECALSSVRLCDS